VLINSPDQAIVNEYQPGQGFPDHIDGPSFFGEAIASPSLLSARVMRVL
jgi:alkylated DNA repair dioxygenase AlkB